MRGNFCDQQRSTAFGARSALRFDARIGPLADADEDRVRVRRADHAERRPTAPLDRDVEADVAKRAVRRQALTRDRTTVEDDLDADLAGAGTRACSGVQTAAASDRWTAARRLLGRQHAARAATRTLAARSSRDSLPLIPPRSLVVKFVGSLKPFRTSQRPSRTPSHHASSLSASTPPHRTRGRGPGLRKMDVGASLADTVVRHAREVHTRRSTRVLNPQLSV